MNTPESVVASFVITCAYGLGACAPPARPVSWAGRAPAAAGERPPGACAGAGAGPAGAEAARPQPSVARAARSSIRRMVMRTPGQAMVVWGTRTASHRDG